MSSNSNTLSARTPSALPGVVVEVVGLMVAQEEVVASDVPINLPFMLAMLQRVLVRCREVGGVMVVAGLTVVLVEVGDLLLSLRHSRHKWRQPLVATIVRELCRHRKGLV